MATNKAYHGGHRARMRERFLQTGGAAFAEHEILEMLLYHVIPRADTNGTAHALIEAFGSLSGVLEADLDRLLAVEGVGERTAEYISLLGESARRYTVTKLTGEEKSPCLDTPEKIAEFLYPRFLGAQRELAFVLLLDNSMRVLDCYPVASGTVSSVPFSVRQIAERAYTKHAAAVVVAHNHPNGVSLPSTEDVNLTHRLRESLEMLEITLVEHFVFSERSYSCILGAGLLRGRGEGGQMAASSLFDKIKQNFKT